MNKEKITIDKEKYFNLHITEEDVQNAINGMSMLDNYMEQIYKSIEEMRNKYFAENLEVVINKNLIDVFDIKQRKHTIFGCKVSFDNLPKDISFIVREDYKPSYEVLENRINKAIEYINVFESIRAYFEYVDGDGYDGYDYDDNFKKDILEILKGDSNE